MRLRALLPVLLLAVGALFAREEVREVRTERFQGSSTCALCHSNSDAAGAMRDVQGRPVAPFDLWQGTMMANAARDPFFLAAVAAEVAADPERREEIEAKCLHCHAPMASVEARERGAPGVSIAALGGNTDASRLARDGVSCTLCHQILPDGLGEAASFNGGLAIGEDREIFGPHAAPDILPMIRITGFSPKEGPHVADSALCATCHTVILDPDGRRVPEQTPYLEWRNSSFRDAQSCQHCHMPTTSHAGAPIETRIARSTHGGDIPRLSPREPYGRHLFVGGNTLLPAIFRDHREELAVEAPAAAFEATRLAALSQLQEQTARLAVAEIAPHSGGLEITVRVENLAGHRFPTAHPSRRAWLRVRVRDPAGRVLFASGEVDAAGRLLGADGAPLSGEAAGGPLEPHREVVRAPGEVQIYEMVLDSGQGAHSASMLRATGVAKDNRLLPRGWDSARGVADGIAPVGVGGDGNFAGGVDLVHYVVPIPEGQDAFLVEAELLFQTLGSRFAAEFFRSDLPEVKRFQRMFEAADRSPVVVARASLTVRDG